MEQEKEQQAKKEEEQRKLMESFMNQMTQMTQMNQNNNNKEDIKDEILEEVKNILKDTKPNVMDQSHNIPCLDLQLTEEYKLEYRT